MAKTCSLISPFCAPHSICLKISLWLVSFVRKCRSSSTPVVVRKVVVLPSKKQYFHFLKKVFVFQKTCFKVKVFKAFKKCHMKTYRSLKRSPIFKVPTTNSVLLLASKWNLHEEALMWKTISLKEASIHFLSFRWITLFNYMYS